jgi:hypothetical protein
MRFPLRINDDGLWGQFRAWCAEQNVSTNAALLLLIKAAVEGRISIGARRA